MSYLIAQLKAALAGRYAVERELGSGGMATIFLAKDLRHHRRVAIKVLDPEVAAALGVGRFMREIESAARLSHPHILPLHDSGEADGLLYYVMPFVEGESLRHRLEREKQLPLEDALRLTSEVADALDYAHRQGVVHRDIKPENILLLERHAVVADFGIARAIASAGGAQLTATGVIIGTPQYMSPEQVTASREVDGRSDQYSLACVLYEMLAGEPPFRGPTGESLAHQHLNVAPRPVKALRTAVPEGVDRALTKAMAKPAADRYATVAEFAAAVQSGSAVTRRSVNEPIGTGPGPGRPARGGRWLLITAAALLIAAGSFGLMRSRESLPRWLGGVGPAPPPKKAWILVAEFDAPAGDSLVVAATRDLVIAALDQSEIVATVPRDQVRLALEMAGKPASTHVDGDVAREIAYRSAVRTVLEGKVGRLGGGYSLVLRLTDVDSARVVLSLSEAAKDEEALIPTVSRIVRRLRSELGERRGAIQATRPLQRWMTPSFEAYKVLQTAEALAYREGNGRAALAVARQALELDPDFAAAWVLIGTGFANGGQWDSAAAALRQAMARPERLTETAKRFLAGTVADLNGDVAGALRARELLVELDVQNSAAHNNLGATLHSSGRWVEALESYRSAEKSSPFGPNVIVLENQFEVLLVLGRIQEARPLVARLRGSPGMTAPMRIAAAAGQWTDAENLARALWSDPGGDIDVHAQAGGVLASIQASRGQARTGDQTLRQVQSRAEARGETVIANRARWRRIMLALFSRGVAVDLGDPGNSDSTSSGLSVLGVWAAAGGETEQALRLLARSRAAPGPAHRGFDGPVLEAWVAARMGRWEDVLRVLGPAALQGEAPGFVQGFRPEPAAPLIRWLVAEAHEQLGHPDSAATYVRSAIALPPEGGSDVVHNRMAFSFGHRRLVLLYARMGRLEDARQNWEIFSRTFTHPDPEMVPLVEEARTALANAEAMAKSSRR